jgi:hypothetical protein
MISSDKQVLFNSQTSFIMKKITLILALAMSAFFAFAQNNPCPDVVSHGVTNISINAGTNECVSEVYVIATGDVPTQKGLRIQVYTGSIDPANLLADVCHIVPASSAAATYTSGQFTAPCDQSLIYVITRYTASNGTCQGGTCGTTITIEGGPLPIVISDFYANRKGNNVNLTWKTSAEINAKEFIVQKKTGNDWVNVATVAARQITTGASYMYTDQNNAKSVSQYRLLLVDLDNSSKISETRAVKGNGGVSDFIIYPNPSAGDAKVTITDISEPTEVQLIDNAGRVIKTVNMNNSPTVDFNGLQKGMYMIRITNKTTGESLTKKLSVVK